MEGGPVNPRARARVLGEARARKFRELEEVRVRADEVATRRGHYMEWRRPQLVVGGAGQKGKCSLCGRALTVTTQQGIEGDSLDVDCE